LKNITCCVAKKGVFVILNMALFLVMTKGQTPDHEVPGVNRGMYFSHLTRESGLPSDFVMDAVQDFRGYVWIATDNGLARYDGKNITVFQCHDGKLNTIVDNYVIILKESRDSMLWIGTRNGISIYNPFTATFRNFPFDLRAPGAFPCRFVRSFYEENNGTMWIATNDGLVQSSKGSGKFACIRLKWIGFSKDQESGFNFLTTVIADPRDTSKLFLGTMGGILLFDKYRKIVVKDFSKVINGRTSVYDLYIDDNQHLWSCGWFTGLNCCDLKTGKWLEYPHQKSNPITIISICQKNRDEFWLSTIGMGLGIFNRKKGTFRFIRHDPLNTRSIISDDINHVMLPNTNKDLWLVGSEGISIENKQLSSFRENKPPFSFSAITDLYRDKATGRLYVGAFACDGLFVLKEQTGEWTIIREAEPGKHLSLLINSFYRDRKGILWLATNKNLMYLDSTCNRIRQFRMPDGRPLQIIDPLICVLHEDSGGNLWVGTRSDGVVRIDAARTKAIYCRHRQNDPRSILGGSYHRAIKRDKFNRIWISNNEGVAIFEPVSERFLNFFMDTLRKHGYGNKLVYNIENDTLGRMWMTIDGLGLLRVEMKDRKSFSLKLFETVQGLDASSISTMRKDAEGDLWINNVSLVHFNPYSEEFKLYNTQNGLYSMLSVGQKLYIDSDLNIYIPAESGYEVKNKHALEPGGGIINLILEAIEINGNQTNLGYNRHGSCTVNLTADQNNITFFFTAICFDDISNVKYMYKLKGYDQDWYLSGNSREARYTHLPPGKLEFIFKVLNQPDYKNTENHILMNIRPFIWQTWWFISSVAFLVLTLFYLAYHFRGRQLLRLERLRMRIATDLHDDVGSTLSSIYILSEMVSQKAVDSQSVKMLKTIGESSSRMMEKLDDIVWVVNPSNDRFRDLGLRISEFAIPLCESKQISFMVNFDKELTGMRLSMEIRRNVYLIAKETVNNAVKYADCSEISLHFKPDHGGLFMEISDNGKGFDPGSSNSRNGLRNMRLRAKQINASIGITSVPSLGTTVTLMVKTHKRISKTT